MAKRRPNVIVMAGPNGAGKSTAAPALLRGPLAVAEFVNADVIARGLSAFAPEKVSLSAGRIMLARLKELATDNADFAFETTLASRSFAPWIKLLIDERSYRFRLIFSWLPSAEMAIARVAQRFARGGHHVPDETVRRRYVSGISNFFELYQPIATTWRVYNSSKATKPTLVALGRQKKVTKVYDWNVWAQMLRTADEAKNPSQP